MALTDVAIRAAKPGTKLRKLSDGGGLQLWVQPNGSRLWRYAYRFDGKQRLLALGAYPDVTLIEARRAHAEAKSLLAGGEDPGRSKQLVKMRAAAERVEFRSLATEYLEKLAREQKAAATLKKTSWLLDHAAETIGSLPVGQVQPSDVLKLLRGVEARGRYETAHRLKSTLGAVFRYAIATGRAERDPTVALAGALIAVRSTPRPALTDPAQVGGLLRAIDGMEGPTTVRAALQLMALLFPRPGELRFAKWAEFDVRRAIWNIPEGRVKMRRPHAVPLARQAIAVLDQLREATGSLELLFPNIRTVHRPLSEGTMNAALRRLGYTKDQMTPHGFRATASTLLNESGKWNPDAIERQLAHIEGNDVRRAYARGEYWDERVRMMQWWADRLDELKTGCTVIELDARRPTTAQD